MAPPPGFKAAAASPTPPGFVPAKEERAPDWFQRYLAAPATKVVETALSAPYLAQHALMQRTGLISKDRPADTRGERFLAEAVIPQSAVQAGAALATLGAGPALRALGPVASRVPAAASRVAGAALGGEVGGQVTGERTGVGALTGGLSAMTGEALMAAGEKVARAITPLARKVEASRVGQAMGRILPGLGAANEQQLYAIGHGEGKKIINQQFAGVKQQIEGQLRQRNITKLKVPELGPEAMTLEEAITELTAKPGFGPAAMRSGVQARKLYDYVAQREALAGRLNQLAPGTGDLLKDALARRGAARSYFRVIRGSFDPEGNFDTGRMMKTVNRLSQELGEKSGKFWEEMLPVFTRNQRLPVAPDVPFKLGATDLLSFPAGWIRAAQGLVAPYGGSPLPLTVSPTGRAAADLAAEALAERARQAGR